MTIPKWKNAASLIVAAKSLNSTAFSRTSNVNEGFQGQDYAILGLKRNHKSVHLPNTYVFPGGIVDKCDFSVEWLDVFRRRGPKAMSDLDYLRLLTDEKRPLILQTSSYTENGHRSSSLPPELALRLTAIRETFEECGILLARSNRESSLGPLGSKVARVTDTNTWQSRVQSDPSNLLDLFVELDCSPDVWSLYEWSNWLSPSSAPRRYDTIFFMAMIENGQPTVNCNANEISDHKWCSPTEFLSLFSQGKLDLAPPQIYECNRLKEYAELQSLRSILSDSKQKKQMMKMFPYCLAARDGLLYLYKGDELYPECPDMFTESKIIKSDASIEELERSAKFINRISIDHKNNFRIVCNSGNCSNSNVVWPSKL